MSNQPKLGDHLGRLRKRKRPRSKRVGIVMDSRYQETLDEARSKLSKLEMRASLTKRTDDDLAAQIEEAQEELDTAQRLALGETEWFVARAMAPRQFDALMVAHPPTADQKKEARKNNVVASFNFDTFPAALVVQCVSLAVPKDEPSDDETEDLVPLTKEFIQEMLEGDEDGQAQWNTGEFGLLFDAALTVNQSRPGQVASLGNA